VTLFVVLAALMTGAALAWVARPLLAARARDVADRLLAEAGVKDIVHYPQDSNSFAAHHMGTCRMSDNPDNGVVDRNCRVHGCANLYAIGASVFPTVGALQPSLTVAALALRAADHLCPT